jgi:hypothetical protein
MELQFNLQITSYVQPAVIADGDAQFDEALWLGKQRDARLAEAMSKGELIFLPA